MTTLNRGPAEIIAFPLRGRFAPAVRPDDVLNPHATTRVARAVSGSSWYHEEAIREERTKSN
ncbi:MAG: DUF2735 domain-containing protein [Pseudorhodoplanes sp.]|uniref:DUF2735 domain-containing protein n=1 Tax=Pseudorhodoplanes sp. TaxID=1934341 RepID=UPI003D0B4AB8